MVPAISKEDIFNAYHVLFGHENAISVAFLQNLRPSALKEAYRKRAFETHPDRSKALGENEAEMNERFIEAALAYERLGSFMKGGRMSVLMDQASTQRKGNHSVAFPHRKTGFSDHFYEGRLPKRKLLIGQYLYYSGFISWKTLINAITWQKRQRPLVGQIAIKWGMLSAYDIKRILTERSIEHRYKEKFCLYALRKGYITPFERMALLGKQHRIQPPIGGYFIEKSILCSREIEKIVERLRIHNRQAFETK